MKTFPFNKSGTTTAFEIQNLLISRRAVARVLRGVSGVSDVKLGGHFGSKNDVRVSFKYHGADYEVEEPYGDNTRYIVGPKDPTNTLRSVAEIEDAFQRYRPAIWRRLLRVVVGGGG